MKKLITFITALVLGTTAFSQISTNGLVGYWPFNGNTIDYSGSNNNGAVSGATLTTDRFGNANSAYSFDGIDDFINCGNGDSLQIESNITTCAWIKTSELSLKSILSKYIASTGPGWENCLSNSGTTYFGGRAPLNYSSSNNSNTLVADNNWHLIIGQREGMTWRIYVDGILENENLGSDGSILCSSNLTIGNSSQLNYPFSGIIDDVRIYNRALNQTEITALYNESVCFQTITVTDTLIINANITSFNPVSYQNSIKIYPNPTNDHLTIYSGNNLSSLNGYKVKIINNLSQVVYESLITTQSTTIDLNNWTGNGIYFVQLFDNNSSIIDIRKIILQ